MIDRPDALGVEAVVIGGGPAGLSAATWLGRYRVRTVLFDLGEMRNRWVDEAHGYLGLDRISPQELRARALKDLSRYTSVEVRGERVVGLSKAPDEGFVVEAEGSAVATQNVVLATGVIDEFPEVGNFLEHYGASVFHCPMCDGYEAKGKRVVTFGWTRNTGSFAIGLLNWASSVTVVTDGRHFQGTPSDREALSRRGIEVIEDTALNLIGERGALEGVELASGRKVECEIVFFSLPDRPAGDLADQIGCRRTDEGTIAVDEGCMTSVEGVYAAGDITPGEHLIQIAAAKGTIAGVNCAESVVSRRL